MADLFQRRQLPAIQLIVTEPVSQFLRVSRQQPNFWNRSRSGLHSFLTSVPYSRVVHRDYYDILMRIPDPPLWWQEGGIPRYDAFDPEHSTGLGVKEVALVEIACQFTGIRFIVAMEGHRDRSVAEEIRNRTLSYGDPPNVGGVQSSALSETLRVLQYWYSGHSEYVQDNVIIDWQGYSEWRRDATLEIAFPEYDPDEVPVYWQPSQSSNLASTSPEP